LLNFEKNWNYDVFRAKKTEQRIHHLYDVCLKSRIDLNEETHMLHDWLESYEDITEMAYEHNNLFIANSYEKLKSIQRQIYLSPIDYGELYMLISKRLEIANQIKQDIKNVAEEVDYENKKILREAQ
jgi:hypothetical protein